MKQVSKEELTALRTRIALSIVEKWPYVVKLISEHRLPLTPAKRYVAEVVLIHLMDMEPSIAGVLAYYTED